MITDVLTIFLIIFYQVLCVKSDEHDHVYHEGEEVVLWMNTVGPFDNRQETYPYFSLPFCQGSILSTLHYHETLGESLLGMELEHSGLEIRFRSTVFPLLIAWSFIFRRPPEGAFIRGIVDLYFVNDNVPRTEYCQTELDFDAHKSFMRSVKREFWFQMYLDAIPIWGMIGERDKRQPDLFAIFRHKKLEIGYNENSIVEVNFTNENPAQLRLGSSISFSYEIIWRKSRVPFERRLDKYVDVQPKSHWISICNSLVLVLVLAAVAAVILAKMDRIELSGKIGGFLEAFASNEGEGKERGWCKLRGNSVLSGPEYPILLSAAVGTGVQLAVTTVLLLIVCIITRFFTGADSLVSTGVFIFAFSAPINGFVSCLLSDFFGQRSTEGASSLQVFVSALFLPAISLLPMSVIKFVAYLYNTSHVPTGIMVLVFTISLFLIVPLVQLGSHIYLNSEFRDSLVSRLESVPTYTNSDQETLTVDVPEKKWHQETLILILGAGVLPFGSIFVEMYFTLTSFWELNLYSVYSFTLFVVFILFILTACVSIIVSYTILNSQDPQWHWICFLASGSTAIYVSVYSVYYFLFKTKMYGLFQTVFFFGYTLLFSVSFGIMCGAIGYVTSALLVYKVYAPSK